MSIVQEPQMSCTGQSVSDEYRRWVFSVMPAMGRLLDQLDAGATPTFLDVWAGLSESVAFYTECDLKDEDLREKNISMSGKICRFCC